MHALPWTRRRTMMWKPWERATAKVAPIGSKPLKGVSQDRTDERNRVVNQFFAEEFRLVIVYVLDLEPLAFQQRQKEMEFRDRAQEHSADLWPISQHWLRKKQL